MDRVGFFGIGGLIRRQKAISDALLTPDVRLLFDARITQLLLAVLLQCMEGLGNQSTSQLKAYTSLQNVYNCAYLTNPLKLNFFDGIFSGNIVSESCVN